LDRNALAADANVVLPVRSSARPVGATIRILVPAGSMPFLKEE